jgi:Domain of unknown function (DUF4864)
MWRRVLIVCALLSGLIGNVMAAEPSPADRSAMQQIISDQIAAFRADDGTAAYGFASPTIRQIFPTADLFMTMVREGYPQVYRPQKYKFDRMGTSPVDGSPTQHVIILGPDGKTYEAVYSLQQQPNGDWKINGCAIVQLPGLEA